MINEKRNFSGNILTEIANEIDQILVKIGINIINKEKRKDTQYSTMD